MEDQIPEDVVKERFDRLLAEVQKGANERTRRFEGQIQKALVEDVNSQLEGYVTGRLESSMVVHFEGDASLIGKIVDVELTEAKGFYFQGRQI